MQMVQVALKSFTVHPPGGFLISMVGLFSTVLIVDVYA